MSNRKRIHTTYAAQLKASHLQQIEILTGGGRRDYEAILQFSAAAGFCKAEERTALALVQLDWNAAAAVWTIGTAPRSLFAHLPGCGCPLADGTSRLTGADGCA